MEGDEEGMERGGDSVVAVIRGLQDAGLAVTLMSGLGSPRAPRSLFPSIPQYPLTHNEATNTRIPVTSDIGAQVRDDRYTSSYQLAHCNNRPSSPPVRLPEFPLRKPDIHRNQGHFEVSFEKYGSGKAPASSFRSAGVSTPYRTSFLFPDRGTPTFDVRASEAFADSLRKYPLGERSPSAELISKLLSYTQHKNDAKISKSPRSIPKVKPEREKRRKLERDKRRYKDKDIQTYTRTRPKIEGIVEELKSKSFKRMRVHSPAKDSREKRYKDHQVNETYDYLKSTSPRHYYRTAEVRYLSDMSKCIRETIRQIVDDRPEVCSQMHNRYLEHRKRCQSRSAHKQNGESSQADASQLTVIPYNSDACVSACPYKAPPCCYCKKRPPLAKRDSKEEFSRKVTEKIGNWLLDIPTYAKMSAEDKQKRIDMVEELANRLADLKDDEDIEAKARKEVEKCLDKLPMWLPSNKSERDDFKSLVADNLIIKLTRVFEGTDRFDDEITKWIDNIRFKSRDSFGEIIDKDKIAETFADRIKALAIDRSENDDDYHDALKNEVLEMLHELSIETNGDKNKELEKLANKLLNNIISIPASEIKQQEEVDKFGKEILKWIDAIQIKRKDSQGNIVDKEEIKSNVTERLKSLALDRPLDDEDYHKILKNEIVGILEELPIEIQGNESKGIEKLASKLANTLKDIPESEIKPKGNKFDEKISHFLKDIKFKKRDSDGHLIDTRKFADIFAERLKPVVIDRPDDDEEHHEVIKNEILDILEELPIEIEGNKSKYMDKLAEKLTNVIKKIPAHEIKQKTDTDKFDHSILQWMKDIKFKRKNSQVDTVDKEKMIDTFIDRMKSIAIERPEDDDEYHEALKNKAFDILRDMPIEFEGNKDKFVDKLATKLAKALKGIPANEIKLKGDKFDKTILKWLKDIKFKKKDSQGEIVDKEKIAETFIERLKFIAMERPEDDEEFHELLKKEALDILEDLPIEVKGNKDKFINKLTSKLANSLRNIPKSEIKPQVDKFEEKITQWMIDIKLNKRDSQGEIVDKEKIAETFRERLKSVAIDRPENDDDYHETLKKEALNILIDLPIEFKGDKDKFINNLATKLAKTLKDIPASEIKPKADKFDQKISQLIKNIKLKKNDSQGLIVDKDEVEEIFRERLKAIAIDRPEDDDEYHEALMNEVLDILEDLPIEVEGNKSKYAEKIATIFAKSLKTLPLSEIKPKQDKLDKKISHWMRHVKLKKIDSQGEVVHRKKVTDIFRERIRSITTDRPEDEEEYHEALKSETANILEETPIDVDGNKDKHVDKLATKLAQTVKDIPASEINPKTDKFDDKISQWVKGIKFKRNTSQGEPVDKGKIAGTFRERLKSVAHSRPVDDEEYNEALKNEIIDIFNESPLEVKENREKFVEKKATKLAQTLKDIPVSEIRPRTDKFDQKISQWVREVKLKKKDDQGEKVVKKQVAERFSKRLKPLAKERPEDDDEYHEVLKSETTDILRELPLDICAHKEKDIESLADKLAHTLKAIPASDIKHVTAKPKSARKTDQEPYNEDIWEWLEDIPGLSLLSPSEKNKMVKSIGIRLKEFKSKNTDDIEGFEDQIMQWLADESEKTGTQLDSRTLENMANHLSGNIFDTVLQQRESPEDTIRGREGVKIKRRSGQKYKKDCSNEIGSWLDGIPQFSGTKEDKARMIDSLSKKLQDLRSEGILDEDEIQDEITDWLITESNERGIKIDAKTKDALVTQLSEKIAKVQPLRKSSDEIEDEIVTTIWNTLRNIPEIIDSDDNIEMVDQLAKRISRMRKELGENASENRIRKEVDNWLSDFMEYSGLDPKHKQILTKDLTSKLTSILKPNAKHNELKQTINNELSSIINNSSHQFSPQAKKNIGRRVSAFLARNISNVGDKKDQEDIKPKIVRIIDEETNLSDKEAKDLAELFITSAKKISAMERKSDSPEVVRAFISDKVKNAICSLNIDNLEGIKQNLTDLLVNQVLNGEDPDFTTETIMEVLQSANVSKEDAKDLSMRLALEVQDFSSIRRDSTLSLPADFTLNEKEILQTSAIKEITDFMDEVKGDEMDPQTRRIMTTAAQKLAERLCDTITDPNQSIAEKDDTINYEVFKFLKRFRVSVSDHGYDLANRLRTIAATSTPRASMKNHSFYPRRKGFSVGSIYIPDELKKKIEQNFVSDLEETIEDWILDLPVQIDDKALIDNIARNLASDIADRQKYLQSHPEVKLTEEEELEFLKYQVFRAMGKSVEAEDLATIMSYTPALLAVIKDVLTPVLSKPPPIVYEGDIKNRLLEEISMWVEEISSELKEQDIDYDKRQEKVKDLAEKLHKIRESRGQITEKIDNEIYEWLKPLVKEIKHTNMQSMADILKNRLILKGILKDLSDEPSVSGDRLQQDTSQFLEENLYTCIMDWLKSSALYQRRNTSEKQIQENIIQDLGKDVKKVIQRAKSDTDLDMEMLREVKKHIERLPMEPEMKSDKAFIDKTSAQLVDYLKNMQMFENVSGRQSIRPVQYLVSTVNDWMKSLPMNTKSLGMREIDDLKMGFITRLSEALKDPNRQDDAIKNIIQQFLQKLPVDIKKANDPKFIELKVDQLFKNILATPFLAPSRRPTISRDLVESAVQNWAENLPFTPGKTPKQVSDNLQYFTSDISSVLEDTNTSAVDNYKNTLHDKTKRFLKKMPVRSEGLAPDKLHDLAENLVTTIKDKASDLSPKPISNKNAADVLYDNITTWCEDLPLKEGSTPEEKERVNTLKHNLASKLMNKVGELNMNPEILNDDALYENLIQEEINDLLSDLPHSPEMEANIESIKENLMSKVKEIKQKTQDEFAGQTYKQQLRDTISKTLPFDADLSAEGPEPFEVLVDNLADAYVNINFITDSAEQKAAYKNKIANEITKYCNDYLKRHPEAPLDSTKLNQDLFNALKSIPTPKEEIMKSEAEQVRMKDEINNWMKELPLTSESGPEAVQKNKMASVLAKKLVEIEKEKEVNPDIDYEEKTHKEIAKLLKKLPIEPGHEAEIDNMIKNLIQNIQSSEQSRRISASTTRHSIDLGPEPGESSTQPSSEDLPCPSCHRKVKQKPVRNKNICDCKPGIPASTLSTEDRAHLERIRLRNQPCKVRKLCSCRDASVSPPPIDAASQTEITPKVPSVCARIPTSPRLSPCMPAPPCVQMPPDSGSEQEVSPQIIIKEYLWDSGTSKLLGPVYRLPCIEVDTSNPSVPSLQRPLLKTVSIQPSPCSFPERPPCSTTRQTPPRPCINLSRAPHIDKIDPSSLRPCINLGTSPCPSPHQISTSRPCSTEKSPCLPSPRSCLVGLGSSPCPSPHQIATPCPSPLRPCINLGTSPSPIQMPPPRSETQRSPYSTRPCLGRSPCPSPHQMTTPKPCITLPRPVISSQPSPYANRSINSPCPEIPYCSTPRRPILRDPNVPFRQPNLQPNSRTCSPIDRENVGPSRVLRPRVINVGDEDSLNPCRRRNEDERISEYKDSYRPKIYREPNRDSTQTHRDDRMRCCRCNQRIRNVCQRHRSPNCPSTENVRHCSKCCGMPCPHPMGMFFR